MKVFLDTETYSPVPIRNGSHAYAEGEGAEVMIITYAVDDGEVRVWEKGQPLTEIEEILKSADEHWWHNGGMFDLPVIRLCMPELYALLTLEKQRDTLAQALSHSLPGSLGELCQLYGLSADTAKDKGGRALIQLFCKPQKNGGRATKDTHPEKWAAFIEYAKSDIRAMRKLHKRMPKRNYPNNANELSLWHLDHSINMGGICVDVELAQAAVKAIDKEQKLLAGKSSDLTDGDVTRASQRDKLLSHILEEYGITLDDLRKSTVERILSETDLPEPLRELLLVRTAAVTTSSSKYKTLLRSVSSDGRLRGVMQFCGASRTGRVAHRLFQPGNMPRPDIGLIGKELGIPKLAEKDGDNYIATGVAALKAGCADQLFSNVMGLTSNLIRSAIIAPPGKKLVISDWANIEGRAAAFLAGEKWKLQAFNDYDKGIGDDLYKLAYSRSFGVPVSEVDKMQRQLGKVQELACFGPNTKVLTDTGLKNITEVLSTDKVWDGFEWVGHSGVTHRGLRRTMQLAGIEVTQDHLIRTGRTWKQANQLFSNKEYLRQALETGSVNLPPNVASLVSYNLARAQRMPEARNIPGTCGPAYANLKNVYDIVNVGPRHQFTIKTDAGFLLVHNCGYEGGVGAYVTMTQTYRMDLEDVRKAVFANIEKVDAAIVREAYSSWDWATEQNRTLDLLQHVFIACDILKRAWRRAHPAISSYWPELRDSITQAILNPGKVVDARLVKIRSDEGWLSLKLPSGRCLCYPQPRVDDKGISYMGKNQFTRKWERLRSYGGKFFENLCQAFARDILAYSMPAIKAAGYNIVLSVHDEFITEAPDLPEYSSEHLSEIMCQGFDWSEGLPLAAEGFESYRYKKEVA